MLKKGKKEADYKKRTVRLTMPKNEFGTVNAINEIGKADATK